MVLQLAKRTRCGYWAHLASGFDNKLVSPVSLWTLFVELHRLKWARAQAVRRISDQLTTKELDEQSVSVLDQKKRTDMSVKDQGVVGCVFWLEKHCPLWTCTTWSDGKQLYQEVVARLRDAVCSKRPELWENQTWMLHRDNSPAHASLLIRSCLAKHQPSVVPHQPYSPGLAPAHFLLFPKLKSTLKGRRLETTEENQENATQELRAITESAFQEAFQQW